ncbi:MAG TPA: hypothetical protein VL769_11640 [Acidimicrobiia bacterium]|nr:hypothetical protein [Acidimicrobiia bacterium]
MAFLVARKDGRFEIRESVATQAGPRARTLASFRELDDDVLDRAAANARRGFDRAAIQERAAQLAVPRNTDRASRAARTLIAELRQGRRPAPGLVRLLRDELPADSRPTPDTIEQAHEWIGKTDRERGDAVVDLLNFGGAFPRRERAPRSSFPRIRSSK